MGKIKQGILGGFTGKVGGVVGSSWKGIATIKARPISVANPRTSAQIGQRSKMSNVVAFAKPILASTIKPLWDRFSGQKSGYNAFVQRNIKLFENAMPSPAEDLIISEGKMAATPFTIAAVAALNGSTTLHWDDDSGEGFKLATDVAYVVFFNETTKEIGIGAMNHIRSNEAYILDLPNNLSEDDVLHVYLAFRRADGTIVSNTSYNTVTVTA